ncbi:MAG: hypothetical protein LLF76_00295 [Planctomycetaceae bacterium]|nr:hypothetical protein [Planctomycetaceae bacterium]
MSCRKVQGVYKRKHGIQWWVVMCPYCDKSHWINLGGYTDRLPPVSGKVCKMSCGSTLEVVPDERSLKRIQKLLKK